MLTMFSGNVHLKASYRTRSFEASAHAAWKSYFRKIGMNTTMTQILSASTECDTTYFAGNNHHAGFVKE